MERNEGFIWVEYGSEVWCLQQGRGAEPIAVVWRQTTGLWRAEVDINHKTRQPRSLDVWDSRHQAQDAVEGDPWVSERIYGEE